MTHVVLIGPSVNVSPPATEAQLAVLQKELGGAKAELAEMRDALKSLQMQMTMYQKVAEILTERVNGSDARFSKHTHRYVYQGVDFETKWFVTSGRPIVKDEKTDYASVITGTPSYTGVTGIPVTDK